MNEESEAVVAVILADRYFGCRHCYRLSYRRVQEHDKRVDALRRNPAALNAILADPTAHLLNGRALLAIKALGP